jgi:hypothetical protein
LATKTGGGIFAGAVAAAGDIVAATKEAAAGDTAAAGNSLKKAAIRGVVTGLFTVGCAALGGPLSPVTGTAGAFVGSYVADKIVDWVGL